ncbi:hypothetical protein HHI36_010991 [Cryptolaemus montrouzieri]|uniref:Uncharacterized protein n=1 Tax=Cryptolaemus montrouzieri TaxID=559131 RepID=A0ABD2MKH4_9CUCU
MLSESITALMAYVMDMTLLVFMIFHILRLKFLQEIIRNHDEYLKIMMVDIDILVIDFAILTNFGEVQNLDNQMSALFFIDFFLRTVQTAGFCLGGITADKPINQIFGFGCLMCCFSQLTLLYWYGEVLTCESTNISDAIYESPWYKADIETRKIMIMIMRRSQKSLVLTVGKFEKVLLRTVLKNSHDPVCLELLTSCTVSEENSAPSERAERRRAACWHLATIPQTNSNVLITGDFNYRDIHWSDDTLPPQNSAASQFFDTLHQGGLFQPITEPTRFGTGQAPST